MRGAAGPLETPVGELGGELVGVAQELRQALAPLRFAAPVAYVYNPLDYAWEAHCQYLRRYGAGSCQVLLFGMNPGPWGMAQSGVPFGEVGLVREWLGIGAAVGKPAREHPKRPVQGLECRRSEVSGRRVWGWAKARFGTPERFFERFFVANYCPLLFLEQSGRNRTPDKLPAAEQQALLGPCDRAIRRTVATLRPRWVVGVGRFAERRARAALDGLEVRVGTVLHPSPASPAANRGWEPQVSAQLQAMGIAVPESAAAPGPGGAAET